MKKTLLVTLIVFLNSVIWAQEQTQVKTEKYNGYGIPNTKFKKIKVDLTKKNKSTSQNAAGFTAGAAPVKLTPVSQSNNVIVAKAPVVTEETKLVTFNMALNSGYNRLAEKQEDGSTGDYLQHELIPTLNIGNYKMMGDFIYNDDLKNPSENEWKDSALLATRKAYELGRYITLVPVAAIGLPLSKSSREETGLKYSVGASTALGLNTKNMGFENVTLNYSLGYSKFTTEFETKSNGEPAPNYRIRQRLNFGYNFTDKFNFKSRFQFDSINSNANVIKNSFLHFENFEYSFTDHISANIGHTNSASAFNIIEGQQDFELENNVKFYDPKTSEISIGIGLSI